MFLSIYWKLVHMHIPTRFSLVYTLFLPYSLPMKDDSRSDGRYEGESPCDELYIGHCTCTCTCLFIGHIDTHAYENMIFVFTLVWPSLFRMNIIMVGRVVFKLALKPILNRPVMLMQLYLKMRFLLLPPQQSLETNCNYSRIFQNHRCSVSMCSDTMLKWITTKTCINHQF